MTDELVLKSIVSDERIIAKFSDEKLPRYARLGELYVTDGILYVYVDLADDGNGKWFPLTSKKEVFTFEQIIENTVWTIPYTYQTDNLQIIVYDQNNRVHTIPFEINKDDSNITITFDEPARGEAYLIANKSYKWFGDGLIVGDKRFSVNQDITDPEKYYLEIDTEFIEILENGNTTFKKDVEINGILSVGALSINGSQILDGDLSLTGNLTVDGTISSVNITSLTSRVLSLEILTSSNDINLDTIQEIVEFIKENRESLSITWTDIHDKPTTLSGYGITDAYTKLEVNANIEALIPTFETLTGKPTTLSGYGITDAYTKSEVDINISSFIPAFDILSGKPTTLSGYGITDAYTKIQVEALIPTFDTLIGKPTTLSGYGITDAYTKLQVEALIPTFDTITNKPTTLSGYGITDAYTKLQVESLIPTFDTLTGKPTTLLGYGITNAFTQEEVYSVVLSAVPTFDTLTGKPTTIDGYGITDGIKKSNNITIIGSVTGTSTFDANGNMEISTNVVDDSHNHIISNIDGLQDEIDNIGSYNDFSDGYNAATGEILTLTNLGTLQDFIDGLNGL